MEKWVKLFGRMPACLSVAASVVLVGLSNQYQRQPKSPVEISTVLERWLWSWFRGIG